MSSFRVRDGCNRLRIAAACALDPWSLTRFTEQSVD